MRPLLSPRSLSSGLVGWVREPIAEEVDGVALALEEAMGTG